MAESEIHIPNRISPCGGPRLLWLVPLVLNLLAASPLRAQLQVLPTRPFADWRTVETRNFAIHYPHEMAEWTLPLVSRLESVHEAVSDLVGNEPRRQITVLVIDPYNVANGFALPFIGAPAIILWPTPPDPRSGIGNHMGWGDLLAVHEYAHIAHLTFPNRSPRQRILWRLLPVNIGPVARRAPRWVTEGYATYIEGRLTGSGRPHGVYRPAVLRQWALDGKLPRYRELSGSGDFLGGSMAYLVGSAFLEWLVEQHGEESLNQVWRRLSAGQTRSFSEAFTGVFGGRPEDLYGRFTVEITRQALAAREALAPAGLVDGETFQHRRWSTGDPTISGDGAYMAVVLGAREHPSRVVVWSTGEDEEAEQAAARERERLLQRDPEDVPAIPWMPRPKRPLAVLEPVDGRPHHSPRFLPGGRWVLVVRSEPLGDGTYRPDLFLWDWEVDELDRVTTGAGIREADPSPAGRTAVGVSCVHGICDLVRVDLETGAVTTIHHGLPDRVFYRPRYSPNGRQIVVSVQENGHWRLALTDEDGAPLRYLDLEDDASRYDAAFLADSRSLVAVSEAGGVPNLEEIDLETGATQPLTRVTGAVMAPEPNRADGSIYFLELHAEGIDVNRLHPDSVRLEQIVALEPALWPAAPAPIALLPDTFETETVSRPRAYGLGPERFRFLVGGTLATEGKGVLATLARTDPVGRLVWMVEGVYGDSELWNGGGASVAWRRFRPVARADLFYARQEPAWQIPSGDTLVTLDAEYAGGTLFTEITRDFGVQRHRYRLGGSVGRIDGSVFESDWRQLIFAEYRGTTRQIEDNRFFAPSFAVYGALGRTGDEGWSRLIGTLSLDAGINGTALLTSLTYGTTQAGAGPFEQFVAGGTRPLLFDDAILAQRITMPALPPAVVSGSQIMAAQATATIGPLYPFFWAVSTDEVFKDWVRVVGVQRELNLDPIPLGRLPGIRAVAGVAFILDEPLRHKTRAYLSVGYQP